MEKQNLSYSFEQSIASGSIGDLSRDLLEIGIDQLFSDGIIKEIPIVKSLFSFYQLGHGIKSAILIRNILLFLNEVNKSSILERNKFFLLFSKDLNEKRKLFEKLLLVLDKIEDSEKSIILGKVFLQVVKGNLELSLFYRISHGVELIFIDDIKFFLLSNKRDTLTEEEVIFYNSFRHTVDVNVYNNNLVSAGFKFELKELKFNEHNNDKYKLSNETKHSIPGNYLIDIYWDHKLYIDSSEPPS